jgi:hypothetical protein
MKLFRIPALLLALFAVSPMIALDREAFTVTRYQLEVQIDRVSHVMAVTGRLTLRNGSHSPQKNVTLQVTSSLAWNGIVLDGKPVEWIRNPYTSDIDHTGALSEAIVTLPAAVPAGSSISLDVQYGGAITPDGTRFTRMGVPEELVVRNDWDQISEKFTAVRGLGNVVWYPVSLSAVSMSEGNTVVAAIDAWKYRQRDSQFDARIRVIAGDVKLCIAGVAMTSPCGEFGSAADPRGEGMTNEVSNSIHLAALGDTSPSFAIANYVRLERAEITIVHTPSQSSVAKDFAAAAEDNEPLLNTWLPPARQAALVIELTDPNANPFQTGVVLFTPLRQSDVPTVSQLLMPVQVAARFPASRAWIENGLQRFMQALRIERSSGRKTAIQFLNEYLPPILEIEQPERAGSATADEPASSTTANSLINTSDQILLRGKGAFVFWMLRDMLGDSVLQNALSSYRAEQDSSTAYFQSLLEEGRKRDLEWFFDDWVYRDRGLPAFHIDGVHARPLLESANKLSLVTVTVENRGGAGAEVPVTIQTASGEKTLRVVVRAHQKTTGREQMPEMPTRVTVNDGSVPTSSSSADTTYNVPAAGEKQ